MSNRNFSNSTQMFKRDYVDRKYRSKNFGNSENEEHFEEELHKDLKEAFKMYTRNVPKKPVEMKSNLKVKTLECESNVAQSGCSDVSKNCSTSASQKNEFNLSNKNDAASLDLQKLVNYFFSEEDKNDKYLENIYEKQGAIPKNKTRMNFHQYNSNFKKTDKQVGLNPDQRKKKTHPHQKRVNSSINQAKVSQTELFHCIFTKDFYSGDEILTIDEKICKRPFFYVVPENPLPNFFFSPGSYYITSKPPDSLHDDVVIFHPKKNVPALSELKKSTLSLEKTDTRIPKEREPNSEQNCSMNHLGKSTFQKNDSHLNIGPSDVKINELFKNLETNYDLDKMYIKDLLNSNTSKAPKNTKYKFKVSDKTDRISTKTEENSLMKKNESEDASASESSDIDEEVSDELANFVLMCSDRRKNADKIRGIREEYDKQEILDNTMQKLMSEFPDLDSRLASEVANKFLYDEPGLQNFIDSEHLKIRKQKQLETMISALPNISYEKLAEKYEEFSGDEELLANYIEEEKLADKRSQILLEMQSVFPDADPNFLERKIEQCLDEDSGEGVDEMINELLDCQTYPRISINNVNAERKKLWQLYVENFDVKNFILEVPNPTVFDEKKAHIANTELLMKFLKARYPDASDFFLEKNLKSNNYNLIKTCDALSANYQPMKVSENIFYNDDINANFLKQIVYVNRREDIVNYLQELAEMREIEIEEARLNNFFLSCPLCYNQEIVPSDTFTCPDGHIFCKDCIKRVPLCYTFRKTSGNLRILFSYVSVKFSDGVYKVSCPEKCDAFFSYTALQQILPKSTLSKIAKKQQAHEVFIAKVDGLECCPHCDFAYIPGSEEKIFKCQNPECLTETCRKCGENNHIPLRCEEIERHIDVEARKKIEESMTNQLIRICPSCSKRFVKIDGCNKMVCSCGTMMCYVCRQKIYDYNHFSEGLSSGKKCPLYSDNYTLHSEEVLEAGVQTKNKILQENPNINILYDPTRENP